MPLSRRTAWAVPAVVAVAVAAAATLPSALASAGPPRLAPRSAAELLAQVGGSAATPVVGTVVQTSRLGLPELPGERGATSPLALLTGSHSLRVWSDGPERVRLALLGELAEYDVVRDGRDAWTYSSERDEAVHYRLPEGAHPAEQAPAAPLTPQEAAERALAAVDPSTAVRVDDTARVAGRDAYQLVLEPRDPGSLVGSVRLALDAETSVPLRVQVWSARDRTEPAVEVGFADVAYERPAASVFAFVPPADADVREVEVPGAGAGAAQRTPQAPGAAPADPAAHPVPSVTGRGWASVVELPVGDPQALAEGGSSALLDSLTTRVPEGRLVQTALLSALLTDDGRLLVGAVPGETLRESARR